MTDDQTPTGRLHELLDGMIVEGLSTSAVLEVVKEKIPLGDAQHWMRSSLSAAIRKYLKDDGLVLNHAAVGDDGGIPAKVWVDYEIPEVVTHIQHVMKQQADDDAALERRLEAWCEAHPEAGMTPAKLRGLADRDAA